MNDVESRDERRWGTGKYPKGMHLGRGNKPVERFIIFKEYSRSVSGVWRLGYLRRNRSRRLDVSRLFRNREIGTILNVMKIPATG